MHHYQTKCIENGRATVKSWIQINILGEMFLFRPKKNKIIN